MKSITYFRFIKYRNDVQKYVVFPITLHDHKIQAITEDSHISPGIKIYWKYVDIELKVPRTPNYEKEQNK